MSPDGRYVSFTSFASTLVPGDTNGASDVFVRDRRTGRTSRVSLPSGGGQANGDSAAQAISADGRFVAFESDASNLVPEDTNSMADIFVRDRRTGTTTRVSVATSGVQANGSSRGPTISADGRHVAFFSDAPNLVPGDTNQWGDIFVRDRRAGSTSRVSVSSTGVQGNNVSEMAAISGNGRYIAFSSWASNLVPADTNDEGDIFVRDRRTATTTRVSLSHTGAQANSRSFQPAISADGRRVAFWSEASNLAPGDSNGVSDVFVRDRRTATTTRVSVSSAGAEADNLSSTPSISSTGRYVGFVSLASNLAPGDTNELFDVFVRDLRHATTSRISVSNLGVQPNDNSIDHAISADGRHVAFSSFASNLIRADTNEALDVFLRTRIR